MSTFAVLGTGPSMSQGLADLVRDKCRVVAVSDSYKLAPWADALVSNDRAWWKQHPEAMKFAGRKFAGAKLSGTEYLMATGIYRAGSNSGLQGLRVAEMLGATRILLLGFDMRGSHFFGEHPSPLRNTTAKRFAAHIAQFKGWYGTKVINCTPGSALTAFPMMDIREALSLKSDSAGGKRAAETKAATAPVCRPSSTDSALVSERHARLYRDYYAQRHIEPRPSGWLDRVEQLASSLEAASIIDYGCGAARGISRFSRFTVVDYDPGLPQCAAIPQPADLVVSIHALEHVEPNCVDTVIDHMLALARKAVLITVSCEPSTKKLPDGSPWHCFVQSADWWRRRLSSFEPQPVLKDRIGAEYAAIYRHKPQ
jgi:hypothetical protein